MAVPASSRVWVDEAVGVLVREFSPLKIFLFGSRARGDGREESDIDLLVVLDRIGDRRKIRDALQNALARVPFSVDVFAVDSAEIVRTGDSVGSFVYPVLREGEVVYGVDDRDEHVWLRYAEEDLEAAERMVAGRGWAPRIACFHAQQAAEKALKAVLVHEGLPLQFTHNLELLRVSFQKAGGRRALRAIWCTSRGAQSFRAIPAKRQTPLRPRHARRSRSRA
jgi:uncharacterized protein